MIVFVRGLRFVSHHGVTEDERKRGQWIEADIEATVREAAHLTDNVADTVDYVGLATLLVETSEDMASYTLEHLVRGYAARVLENMPRVTSISVEVRKPNPPLSHAMDAIGVRHKVAR